MELIGRREAFPVRNDLKMERNWVKKLGLRKRCEG
jgi:hypothetical protein